MCRAGCGPGWPVLEVVRETSADVCRDRHAFRLAAPRSSARSPVNTIAWAVRRDAVALLAERFAGLRWKWIPYVPSGLPLAREIEKATAGSPETNILVLANHGLVVCGEDCGAAERLLQEVEARIAIEPRPAPAPDCRLLMEFAKTSGWRLPDDPSVHALGTDASSGAVVSRGVLYLRLSGDLSFPRDVCDAALDSERCSHFQSERQSISDR